MNLLKEIKNNEYRVRISGIYKFIKENNNTFIKRLEDYILSHVDKKKHPLVKSIFINKTYTKDSIGIFLKMKNDDKYSKRRYDDYIITEIDKSDLVDVMFLMPLKAPRLNRIDIISTFIRKEKINLINEQD